MRKRSTCRDCGVSFELQRRGVEGECCGCRKLRVRKLPEVKAKRAAYLRAWRARRLTPGGEEQKLAP